MNIKTAKNRRKFKLSVPRIIVSGFLLIIFTGTILLSLPISSADHKFTGIGTAMFTSLSATCVTGLIIEDTATYWSLFGQIVILVMIQIGGIGFMSVTVLLSMIIKRDITPRERLIISQSLGLNTNEGIINFVRKILFGTFFIEFAGAIVLSAQFIPQFGIADGIYKSIFHSISAFCNAGFDLMGGLSGEFTSVTYYRYNIVVCVTLMALVIVGGIGFVVWDDLYHMIFRGKRMTAYTKFVLLITIVLLVIGTLLIFMFEYSNPDTIANDSLPYKLFASLFHSVMTRTAGFTTINNGFFTESTVAVSIFLMFIGGASGSTAGGVKIATFGILVAAVTQISSGKSEILIFKRVISKDTVLKAMTVVVFAMILILVSTFIIATIDGTGFMLALYESAASVTTSGITMSLTPSLSTASHILLMLMMFLGRIGILTFTYSISTYSVKSAGIKYPETYMPVG